MIYKVTLNYGGMGNEYTYKVKASDREEAKDKAKIKAMDDFEVVDVYEEEENDD